MRLDKAVALAGCGCGVGRLWLRPSVAVTAGTAVAAVAAGAAGAAVAAAGCTWLWPRCLQWLL